MNVKTETLPLKVSDGTEMPTFVARPPGGGGKHPGILVYQEIYGVNSHIRNVAERFAAEGYVAIAPELFHRSAPPAWEAKYTQMREGMAHAQKMTPQGTSADIKAAFEWLASSAGVSGGPIAAVGFCMGGRVAFQTNAELPLRAAVSFYGGGIAPGLLDKAPQQHGPLLLFWGGKDAHITPDHTRSVAEALQQAKKDFVEVKFGQADHGFFCNERASYNPNAARQAWALMKEFLGTYMLV